jgi:DNA gyrase/topoisomerase IV subunit A
VDSRQASRLEILQAVATVLDDPVRFLTIVSGCRDNAEALERVMGEYNVNSDAATHMLATNFRRATSAERAKVHEEIESVRNRLAL